MKGTNYELTADQLDFVTGGGIVKEGIDLIKEELKTEKPKTVIDWIIRYGVLGLPGVIWGFFQKKKRK